MSLDQLTADGATVIYRAEIALDGDAVDLPSLRVLDGTVTYDANARVRRACDAVLHGEVPALPTDPLAPIGSEVRLFRGAVDWTGEEFEEPLGRYAFDETNVERQGLTSSVTGFSYEQVVSDARWEESYLVQTGNVVDRAVAAVESRLPESLWRTPVVSGSTLTTPSLVWGEEVQNDPMEDVTRLVAADGLEASFDREGRLNIEPIPDPEEGDPRWDLTAGTSLLYLGAAKRLVGRPYNVVVARGETEDDTPPVRAVAIDNDPDSASFVGRYRRPYFLTSPLIETVEQAAAAAEAQLNRLGGLAEIVVIQMVPHPGLDVRQVVLANDPELRVDARYVIDHVSLPLRPGVATLTTRRRRF